MQAVQLLNGQNLVSLQSGKSGDDSIKKTKPSSFEKMLEKASRKVPAGEPNTQENRPVSEKLQKTEDTGAEPAVVKKASEGQSPVSTKSDTKDTSHIAVEERNAESSESVEMPVVLFGCVIEQSVALPTEATNIEAAETLEAANEVLLAVNENAAAELTNRAGQEQVVSAADASVAVPAEFGKEVASEIAKTEANAVPVIETSEVPEALSAAEVLPQGGKSAVAKKDAAKTDVKPTEQKTPAPAIGAGLSSFQIADYRGEKNAVKTEKPALVAEHVTKHENTLDVTLNLEQQNQTLVKQNILSTNDQTAASNNSTFQQMLANQLENNAPEFVKAGNIILKDNDTGVINLNLKPATLGNVKISLEVSDKGIEGRIVVATKEAFEAFSQNMDNLRHSFQQNGFDSANLNLSLNDGSFAGRQGSGQGQNPSGNGEFFANKAFGSLAEGGDALQTKAAASAYGGGDYHVDVVA